MLSSVLYIQFVNNPVNIIMLCIVMPMFHYWCVLLITCKPDNISKPYS